MTILFQQAVAALDRRLDEGQRLSERDVWSLLAFRETDLVRRELSRLLSRVEHRRSIRSAA